MEQIGQDKWQRMEGWLHAWTRNMHGHSLVIYKPNSGGPNWFKWIDGHFRGSVDTLKTARLQLEREAAGEDTAWGAK